MSGEPPALSVILSTYNAPDELERTLWGYSVQTCPGFDVVVADDGSGPETRDRIEHLRISTGLAISHVWQEDDGFRKCRILNRAIVEARGDYLILSDGDCIPRNDFVDAHARLAEPGCFVSGGRVRLSSAAGSRIERDDVLGGSLFEPPWLDEMGALSRRRDRGKLIRSPLRAEWLDRLTTTRATWNGHNASAWKTDLLRVNGFDERMTYPVEDRELGERLRNAGIRPIQARHRAVCAHVEHARPWLDPEAQATNERLRAETRGGRDWTEHGIRKGPRPRGFPTGC
ncbi:MAG: glycosyltransferase family 2 protein [Gemmatimonadota bacterium]|uniref:glycosyltransferase family 2 protein n=1 Tax=Candidatus Palauibacter scopulicola TaxID=3056741 RepID=UPI00238BDBBC|nr:glycosyltransferase family 2 protein [Candidatus Palauibacter scopulicola]MDE2664359.1 glycosyltransferase family 2 protein [Candidatus Palauibacter scopulicola]